ncbi:hypothetical protein P3W45_001066 [Vairimorpha bombi]|jgi:hypothetical protein
MFFFFLISVCCEIFGFDSKNPRREVVFDVTGDQICKGFFEPTPESDGKFKVLIKTQDGNIFFESEVLTKSKPVNFAFNITDNRDLHCIIEAIYNKDTKNPKSDLEIKFETQFDTFRKDIAKQVRVEPATYSLTKIGNLMTEMNIQTDDLVVNLGMVDNEHKRMFVAAVFLSIATLVVYVGVQIYLFNLMRNFFKTKKLI